MSFNERLKELRIRAGISQEKLARELGASIKSIGNYELGHALPSAEQLPKIAKYFGVSIDSLLTEQEEYVAQAYEKGGARSAKDVSALIADVSGMFAGGTLSEDDKDAAMKAMLNAYWIAKEENKKKFTPKRYRAKPERKVNQTV